MENTKLELWTNRMNNYVNETSRHLFKNEFYNHMMKVIPFKHGDKKMVARVTFGEEYFSMRIEELKVVDTNSLSVMKDRFFPKWYNIEKDGDKYITKVHGYKSMPNFKKMRNVTEIIQKYLEKYYDGTTDKTLEIKGFVENMVKSEKFFEKNLIN